MSTSNSGYSGTPLAKKLGIADGCHLVVKRAPVNYLQLLAPMPSDVVFDTKVSGTTDIIHLFSANRAVLQTELVGLRHAIKPNGVVWISWPKKASKVPTDITEDTIRDVALPLGFVDIKVCAVSDIWSGLKLVIRKELR